MYVNGTLIFVPSQSLVSPRSSLPYVIGSIVIAEGSFLKSRVTFTSAVRVTPKTLVAVSVILLIIVPCRDSALNSVRGKRSAKLKESIL